MSSHRVHILVCAAASLFAAAALALVVGCKGNTSAAAVPEKTVTAPPTITIFPAPVDPRAADPLTAPVWTGAAWYTLVAPSDTARTTPPVRAALLYDAATLYVAFVSDTVPPPAAPVAQDFVSVYLDSSAGTDGTEIAQISVSSTGQSSVTWIRSNLPAKMKENGSPDWMHVFWKVPNIVVKGLGAKTWTTRQNGAMVWTAVLAIPLQELPPPFRQAPSPGAQWKINLLRTITTRDTGGGTEQLQANLSQVYLGAQAVSPYRMAKLLLATPPVATAR